MDARAHLPAGPGTYLLALVADRALELEVGRAGILRAPPGVFLYAGSALGSGGLRARLGRHLEGSDVRKWHIDHLRAVTQPAGAWWRIGRVRREHRWAKIVGALPGAEVFLPRFGASDCKCPSHLFWVPDLPDLTSALGPAGQVGGSPPSRGQGRSAW